MSDTQKDIDKKVYAYVKSIPIGKVTTYGHIAKELSIPSPRMVGRILHNNNDPENVPCHRVVFADGSLSEAFAFGGREEQQFRLLKEGIKFNENQKVLAKYMI